jgi:hypothetical protein
VWLWPAWVLIVGTVAAGGLLGWVTVNVLRLRDLLRSTGGDN